MVVSVSGVWTKEDWERAENKRELAEQLLVPISFTPIDGVKDLCVASVGDGCVKFVVKASDICLS